jgi:hypothetical protein
MKRDEIAWIHMPPGFHYGRAETTTQDLSARTIWHKITVLDCLNEIPIDNTSVAGKIQSSVAYVEEGNRMCRNRRKK